MALVNAARVLTMSPQQLDRARERGDRAGAASYPTGPPYRKGRLERNHLAAASPLAGTNVDDVEAVVDQKQVGFSATTGISPRVPAW
jgi:hypothetical protein